MKRYEKDDRGKVGMMSLQNLMVRAMVSASDFPYGFVWR
jgi:hypothetical protein